MAEELNEQHIIKALRELERLMQTQPGAHAQHETRAGAIRQAYRNSMRVVSQTMLGVEPEEVLAEEPPPPSEEVKQEVGKRLRNLARVVKFTNPNLHKHFPQITATEEIRAYYLKKGLTKESADAVYAAAKQLGMVTPVSAFDWFRGLTAKVMHTLDTLTRLPREV